MKINRALVATLSGALALASVAGCNSSSETPGRVAPPRLISGRRRRVRRRSRFRTCRPCWTTSRKAGTPSTPSSTRSTRSSRTPRACRRVCGQRAAVHARGRRTERAELGMGWPASTSGASASLTDSLIPGAQGRLRLQRSTGRLLGRRARRCSPASPSWRSTACASPPWTSHGRRIESDAALATLSQDGDFKYPLSLGNPDISTQ